MERTCAACGKVFAAQRGSAKYCSARCRQRRKRAPVPVAKSSPAKASAPAKKAPAKRPAKAPLKVAPEPPAEEQAPIRILTLAASTYRALERAGRLDVPAGVAALMLAYRLDGESVDTGSSIAALVKEHRAALAEALKDAASAADPVDELRKRRDAKRTG